MSPFLFVNTNMTISHASITDPNIHEPKGINVAAANTAYLSNGAGSGVWSKFPTQSLAGISGNGISNQVVVVNGVGAHSLQWSAAHGFISFLNIGSPSVITYPSVYAKVAATTTPEGNARDFTEGTNARLTYTGSVARQAVLEASLTVSQSSGSDRDVRIAIYKNGVILPSSEDIITAISGGKRQVTAMCNAPVVNGDYFEVFIKNDGASGDVSVFVMKLSARALLS